MQHEICSLGSRSSNANLRHFPCTYQSGKGYSSLRHTTRSVSWRAPHVKFRRTWTWKDNCEHLRRRSEIAPATCSPGLDSLLHCKPLNKSSPMRVIFQWWIATSALKHAVSEEEAIQEGLSIMSSSFGTPSAWYKFQNSQNAQKCFRRVLTVIWCFLGLRGAKESLALCRPCLAPGETAWNRVSHRFGHVG